MITLRHDEQGKVVGFVDWVLVSWNGTNWELDDKGETCIVHEAWVHDRHQGVLKDMLKEMGDNLPWVKHVTYERHEKGRGYKYFKRESFRV